MPITEYEEAGRQHRLHVTLFFSELTVFLVVTAGLIDKAIKNIEISPSLSIGLSLIGIFVSFVFFIVSKRAAHFMMVSRDRAKEIGEELGYRLYSNWSAQNTTIFTATRAVLSMYWVVLIWWVFLVAKAILSITKGST